MKTGSKIALGLAAVAAFLFAKKKGGISGIGSTGVKYVVRYTPKSDYEPYPLCWLWISGGYANLQNNRDQATRFDTYEEAYDIAQKLFNDAHYDYYRYYYKGFQVMEVKDHDEERVKKAIDWLLSQEDSYRYRMLDRMRMDCEYYLGNGGRHGKHLWMTMDPQGHIEAMRALWNSFDDDKKPEWLSMEQIDHYAKEMGVGKVEHSDYDGARVISKDGRHAISFDIFGHGENGITVTSEMKGGGERYGFGWEFLSHIGDYKTLSGAINAAKKYWDRAGIEYNERDFNKI